MTRLSYKVKLVIVVTILFLISLIIIIDSLTASNLNSVELGVGLTLLLLLWPLFSFFIFPLWRLEENAGKSIHLLLQDVTSRLEEVGKKCNDFISNFNRQNSIMSDKDSWLKNVDLSIDKTIKNISDSRVHMDKSNRMAEEGTQVLSNLRDAMNGIKEASSSLEGIITMIGDINKKTKIINEIVFETKLLSFNASIEAARAGQYGKGFAVVAQEIGNLALMSGKAALGISSLLDSSTNQVKELINYIQTKIKEGENATDDCKRVFGWISEGVLQTVLIIEKIVSFVSEQQTEVKHISDNINKLGESIASNSEIFQEIISSVKLFESDVARLNRPLQEVAQFLYSELGNANKEFDKISAKFSGTDLGQGAFREIKFLKENEQPFSDDSLEATEENFAAINENKEPIPMSIVEDKSAVINSSSVSNLTPSERAKDIATLYNNSLRKGETEKEGEIPKTDDNRFVNKSS